MSDKKQTAVDWLWDILTTSFWEYKTFEEQKEIIEKAKQMEKDQMFDYIKETYVSTSYLILSGEGNIDTEHQFCMELNTLEEANFHFNNFKRGQFKDTYLYIYEAKKIREE